MSPTGETPAAEPTERNWHVIVGSNGMCECGVKADGTVVRCGELHRAEVEALAKRLSGADGGCRHGVAWDVHCCNCHSGFIFDRDHKCPAPHAAEPTEHDDGPTDEQRRNLSNLLAGRYDLLPPEPEGGILAYTPDEPMAAPSAGPDLREKVRSSVEYWRDLLSRKNVQGFACDMLEDFDSLVNPARKDTP